MRSSVYVVCGAALSATLLGGSVLRVGAQSKNFGSPSTLPRSSTPQENGFAAPKRMAKLRQGGHVQCLASHASCASARGGGATQGHHLRARHVAAFATAGVAALWLRARRSRPLPRGNSGSAFLRSESGPRKSAREWLAKKTDILTSSLIVVWLAFFCDYVLMTMVIPIFPLLNKSNMLIGALFAAKAMCQIAFSPLMARFVDRHEKSMIVCGLALEALSVSVFAFTSSYGVWFFARALSGVASAAIISAGLAHLNKRYGDVERRAVAMGLATTGIVGGVCLGPLLGGALYEAFPSLPFALLAGLQILVAAYAVAALPKLEARKAAIADRATIADMLREADVLRPLGALVAANAAISCLESTIARHLTYTFGLTTGQIGAMFLLVSVPSCVMSGFAGPLGNRFGRTVLLRVGLVVQGFFTALGPKTSSGVVAASLLGLGAGMGLVDGATPPLLGEVADKRFGGSGKIFVLSNVAVQMGFVLGPLAGNAVVQACGFGVSCLVNGGVLLAYSQLVSRPRSNRTT
mmetsp:Transcript_36538/g.73665  ORF Transcript_36538/g.73665 Transcript_36538/m.73665 type:complete len:522 (+) Transcript_36538:95-1660(+)